MDIEEIQERLKAKDAVRIVSQATGIRWSVIKDIQQGINQNPEKRTMIKLIEFFENNDDI